jgi:diguanylate cyclase (GGDEF)-like protein
MLTNMPACRFSLYRIAAMAIFVLSACELHAQQASTKIAPAMAPPAPLVVEGLGNGTFTLSGPWQFRSGDDPAWANPSFDSSGWEQLTADQPWGQQGHANLTGFAWYRLSIAATSAPGVPQQFSLLVPKAHDSYEIYWNGSLIGRNGKLPPRPVWYISQRVQTFELGQPQPGHIQHGTLAVRVWKAPLLSDDSGERGGFDAAPLIGSPEAIATAKAAYEFHWLHGQQLYLGANLLCAVIALLSLLLWLRAPSRWVLFWTTGFVVANPVVLLLLKAHMGWPYSLAMALTQPLLAIQDVSLWFLLLRLLLLHESRAISRLTRILACVCIANSIFDGAMVAISWNPQWIGPIKVSDAVSTTLTLLLEAFPLVLVSVGFFRRKQLAFAPWVVAILAFLDEMMNVFGYVIKQGRQFTAWPLASKIDSPLFSVGGSGITLSTLAGAFLLIAIVYAVYDTVRQDQRRQDAMEREKMELIHESMLMRYQAEHDGLTGLWNHRIIVQRLGIEMNRSLREESPLSVVLIDVDHFKRVNDSFGHLAGDRVLKAISEILTSSVRPYDYVGRYGGEEFLLILPDCAIESALIRAEELRLAVQAARMMEGETTLQVTASFGVGSAFPSHYEPEAVIRAVDSALYQAKSSGRNCVIQAEIRAEMKASLRER